MKKCNIVGCEKQLKDAITFDEDINKIDSNKVCSLRYSQKDAAAFDKEINENDSNDEFASRFYQKESFKEKSNKFQFVKITVDIDTLKPYIKL